MFTGIVEELGTLESIDRRGDSARLRIRGPLVTSDAGHGDSIAVNGVCLTVTGWETGGHFDVDVMAETLDRTALAALAPGDPVNLERAMRADARFGGHIVQGHVDGTGRLLDRVEHEHWHVLRISLPADLAQYVVEKGSITVSGTSLTVSAVSASGEADAWFEVSLIPTTLDATILGGLGVGAPVNLEVDVLAKYVERLLNGRGGGSR
ncbi:MULTISPECIES: riboflavin synthase [Dietzia]|uniref:Riboflavin synthase n=1 Tax=Dietzia cinnamea TaxID=321318 RepID=A0AAW5Q416_9ACTN|nr:MULTISPECIES: riboflavin synthase [Dietzia]PWD94836.1 riboflavin synthase [Dietzia maris]MBM7228960.1 riboflavin synthase [Dietzia cinnamea]MCT1862665.1 riboflavin synthase [Dietzia cinnamea]MCT2028931.1 riboflavin synthase [Dietzia cinnamea]MCT2032443.1 riboflavin synthase [Dietzia cinnamea]